MQRGRKGGTEGSNRDRDELQYSALFIARSTINCHLPFRHSLSAAVLIKKETKSKKLSKLLWGNYFISFATAEEGKGRELIYTLSPPTVPCPLLLFHFLPPVAPWSIVIALVNLNTHTPPKVCSALCIKLSTSLICHCPCCCCPLLPSSPCCYWS